MKPTPVKAGGSILLSMPMYSITMAMSINITAESFLIFLVMKLD